MPDTSSPIFSSVAPSRTIPLRAMLAGAFTETVSTGLSGMPPTSSRLHVVTGFLPAARMSLSCGIRGSTASEVMDTTAGGAISSTSTSFSSTRSTKSASPSARTLPVAFTTGRPSSAPTSRPTCWEYRSAEPSPQTTRSKSILRSAAASTEAVWNASASSRAGSTTRYSSSAPRDRAAFTSFVSFSFSPPAESSTAPPSVAAASCAAASMAARSYSPSTHCARSRRRAPSAPTSMSWASGTIL